MAARIALQLPWNPDEVGDLVALARAADDAGVHSLWINEGFGHDAFSGLTILARETRRVLLGTSVVNVFSRTPGALAQHFATLDQLSGGRAIAGLGASAPGVVERFHGLPYRAPLARLQEAVELLRAYWRRERFSHKGRAFHVERSLILGAAPVQSSLPIYLATMAPASVRLTAAIADGWLPAFIPMSRLGLEIATLREAARAAHRPPSAVTIRAPGTVTVTPDERTAARVRRQRLANLAFFIARNGDLYFHQFRRQGFAAEAAAIRDAWNTGGREEAVAAIPPGMAEEFDFAGDIDACRERIAAQTLAGVDLHPVALSGFPAARWEGVLSALTRV